MSKPEFVISPGDDYETLGGAPVKIYSVDNGGHFPIHGAIFINGSWAVSSWREDGTGQWNNSSLRRRRRWGWVNIFETPNEIYAKHYATKEAAESGRMNSPEWSIFKCIAQIPWIEGEGLSNEN